jgi:hypothetical protein
MRQKPKPCYWRIITSGTWLGGWCIFLSIAAYDTALFFLSFPYSFLNSSQILKKFSIKIGIWHTKQHFKGTLSREQWACSKGTRA